ncbi:putative PurR-regulated permease PerM [Kineococcus xinjiangensis]|uniref:Putative PurR-regulated permease PerM n=1 Tax=Kineococcus xinjiangensis TaxID=512762 RepID=A0A2S6ICT8_9ACTN|nr:AI-2E family transporter [Kineococcus xinjiangensis]PPK92038.1 putative PurR-regulated permease PerM [Kineococcus xinjiangensis]
MSERPAGPLTDEDPPVPVAATGEPTATVVGRKVASSAQWALRLLILGVAAYALLWLIGKGWSLIFPLLLGVLLAAVLWPLARLLRRFLPAAAAAGLSLLILLGVLAGVFASIIPSVADQAPAVAESASEGLDQVQQWVAGPPLNLGDEQLGGLINQGIEKLQANAQTIAISLAGGLGTLGSGLITTLLVLVLAFFCLNDGDKLLPWSRRWLDERTWRHTDALGRRLWTVMRGYILAQAAVALADAILIGIGLVIVGVPFALPLAVIIFFSAFIPIIGAIVSGLLAVLVALVTGGLTSALIILGVVFVVQQIEGNVLQPLLVGHTMNLHPAVVIAAVTIGGTLYGITGAFLAVPVAAVIAVVLRYARHTLHPDEPENPVRGEREQQRIERIRRLRRAERPQPAETPQAPA